MLRGVWALLAFIFLTTVVGGSAFIASIIRGREIDIRAAALWSRGMLRAVGVTVEYSGTERIARTLPCIFAANHQSNVDIWAVTPVLPMQTKFVVKQSLFSIPILGSAMRRAGYIPIDRNDRRRAIRSLESAGRRIRAGRPVIVFPEGTRSLDGRLGPFKKGSFHLALSAGVPIVPVAISGSWKVLKPGEFKVRPGAVKVRFLEPIDVTPYLPDRLLDLRRDVHDRIAEALGESGEVPEEPTVTAGPE